MNKPYYYSSSEHSDIGSGQSRVYLSDLDCIILESVEQGSYNIVDNGEKIFYLGDKLIDLDKKTI